MNDERFHDILMIWLLRRLDLSRAKKDISETYSEMSDNGELNDMSKDELTLYLLNIMDRYELPCPRYFYDHFKHNYPF